MADQYTEVTKKGFGSRLGNSFVGILIGIVLIIGSIYVLFTNEGRVDISKIASSAAEISSEKLSTDGVLENKLVSSTGVLSSDQLLGDDLFLKPGRNIVLQRKVEMYSWVENTSSKSKKELGGSETTETTYTYSKKWTDSPKAAGEFRHPEGHENPERAHENADFKVATAKVGIYELDPSMASFPALSPLQLNEQKVNLSGDLKVASKKYLFSGKGTISAPQVGDLRISYISLPEGSKVTIFGKLAENSIMPYLDKDNNRIYRLFLGDRGMAIDELKGEYKTTIWLMRLIGFLMMWIGLGMIFEPLSVLLDILPMLGSVSRFMVGVITFLVSLAVSIVIIIVSMIVHNLLILLIVLAITAAVVVWQLTQRKKK